MGSIIDIHTKRLRWATDYIGYESQSRPDEGDVSRRFVGKSDRPLRRPNSGGGTPGAARIQVSRTKLRRDRMSLQTFGSPDS